MAWTILILVLAVALFLFSGLLFKHDGKKPFGTGKIITIKTMKVLAVILIAGSVTRLWVPYYLVNVNPMILQDMAQNMQAQKQEEGSKEIRKFVRANMDKLTADAVIQGNVNAAKTIIIFSDHSCPYCHRVYGELKRVLADRNDVRIVWKNFSIHGVISDIPARATLAARIQSNDKAVVLHNALMTGEYFSQDDLKDQSKIAEKVTAKVMKLAEQAGLDTAQLKKDMNGDVVARELAQVRDLADRFQIGGTPFLIIGDQAFPGAIPYDQIIKALN